MSRLPQYKTPSHIAVNRESGWQPERERQNILERYARTVGSLKEYDLDDETCRIVYIPQYISQEKPLSDKDREAEIKTAFRTLADELCEDHPAISTDTEVLGGAPHIKGTRLSVGKVLAKLYVYGNLQAILDSYEPHLSEEQVKEAIAYAQDFLEIACDPDETP